MRTLFYVMWMAMCFLSGLEAKAQTIPKLGIIASLDRDSLVYASGFEMNGESVGKMLSPSLTEAEFAANVERMKKAKAKIYVCNVLFPSDIKLTGPEVEEQRVLAHVDKVFERAKKAGVPLIVLGSGGARRVPENYDHQAATKQFTALCRKIAMVAKKHGVMVALESLNSTETNFLNTLEQAAGVVRGVNHPNFRLNADIYHMMKENEPPQHIIDAGSIISYVELAEKEKRTLPGVVGEDFKPYFRALETIGYSGPIFIEGSMKDPGTEIPNAYTYLTEQLQEVYSDSK